MFLQSHRLAANLILKEPGTFSGKITLKKTNNKIVTYNFLNNIEPLE